MLWNSAALGCEFHNHGISGVEFKNLADGRDSSLRSELRKGIPGSSYTS
jgi:hypothetical protein